VGHTLFKAIAHIGAVNPEASSEVVDMLCDHLAELRSALHGGNEEDMGKLTACMRRCIGDPDRWNGCLSAMAILMLSNYHEFIVSTPLVRISPQSLVKLLTASHELAVSPGSDNLEASLYSSQSGSPISTSDNDGAIRLTGPTASRSIPGLQGLELQRNVIRRFSKLELAYKVLDVESTLLSQCLVGGSTIEEPANFDISDPPDRQASTRSFSILASRPIPDSASVLHLGSYDGSSGREILEKIASQAVTWWEDIMHGQGIGIDNGLIDGRNRSDSSDEVENLAVTAILVRHLSHHLKVSNTAELWILRNRKPSLWALFMQSK
jgi:hypothetical protein